MHTAIIIGRFICKSLRQADRPKLKQMKIIDAC